ncbi:MAG: peptide deformylase [Deltaproteobacteria bacterium]
MAILNILKYPDPFLKTKAGHVASVDASVKALIRDMSETMYIAKGIGLAATQVGAAKRVIVLDVPPDSDMENLEQSRGKNLIILVNPEITASAGTQEYDEGCLSLPGITAYVKRAVEVMVKGLDREGKPVELNAAGLLAVALQHEIDHLDGILFIDRLSSLKRGIIKRRLKKNLEAANL